MEEGGLVRALKEKKIFWAGIDVVKVEPIKRDHPLLSLENCFLIPHIGSSEFNGRSQMSLVASKNILAFENL